MLVIACCLKVARRTLQSPCSAALGFPKRTWGTDPCLREATRRSNLDSGHIFFRLVSLVAVGQTMFVLVFHLKSSSVHMLPTVAERLNQDSMTL